MATAGPKARRNKSARPPEPNINRDFAPQPPWIQRALDGTFHFLASLKLAVITLGAVVAVLAYATFYESWYGSRAVGEDVYKSPFFGVILTLLGANILCAALSRLPWKQRHTGFVVTHAGLLTVLLGTFLTLNFADEGMLAMREGESTNKVFRSDMPLFRVRPIDSKTGQPNTEYQLNFRAGTEQWNPEKPDLVRNATLALFHPFSLDRVGNFLCSVLIPEKMPRRTRTLPVEDGAFGFAVLDHIPAAQEKYLFEPVADGLPMVKLGLKAKPPGSPVELDLLTHDLLRWQVAQGPMRRTVLSRGPAQVVFQYVDSDRDIQDFLNPPDAAGSDRGAAWFYYPGEDGKVRRFDWKLGGQEGKSVPLPDSRLTARFDRVVPVSEEVLESLPVDFARFFARVLDATGGGRTNLAMFSIRNEATGKEYAHLAIDGLPAGSESHFPLPGDKDDVTIGYFQPQLPLGQFGRFELLGTKDGKLYYRVIGRDGLRGKPQPVAADGTVIPAFGGDKAPMSLSVRIDEYLPSGKRTRTFVPVDLAPNQLDRARPAALVRMTVGGDEKEFWIRPTEGLTEDKQRIEFPSGSYEVSYDMKRHELDFTLKLVEFDVGFDPGTRQPASYESDVLVTDAKKGLDEMPVKIWMNHPYTNGDWTFYQANFTPTVDPETDQTTGEYSSVFQVRYDPPWCWGVVYSGCFLVVLGTFLQFYMKAGVFSQAARERVAGWVGKDKEAKHQDADSPSELVSEGVEL